MSRDRQRATSHPVPRGSSQWTSQRIVAENALKSKPASAASLTLDAPKEHCRSPGGTVHHAPAQGSPARHSGPGATRLRPRVWLGESRLREADGTGTTRRGPRWAMFLFASQLRSRFSTSPPSPRSRDRPLPPFLFRFRRRDRSSPARRSIVASAASPPSFFSRHDVTAAAALIQTPSAAARTFAATPVLARRLPPPPLPAMAICKFYQQGNCKFGSAWFPLLFVARHAPSNLF